VKVSGYAFWEGSAFPISLPQRHTWIVSAAFRGHAVAVRVLNVDLGLDATDNDIFNQMRIMKRAREERCYDNVVCTIRDFSDDPRELYDIPEVQVYCKRLVDLGFISYLDFSTFFNPKTPEVAKCGWGASEVWLCSQMRLKSANLLTHEILNEVKQQISESNKRADAVIGPLLYDELDFDLAALNEPGFKEDAVREDIIAPILRKAGYRATGSLRMERSKPLTHPFVMIGSKKHKISIVPDYILRDESEPLLVLEAKAPDEPIVRSVHVEQTYSYAIHPDVRCVHYALCNGRQFAFYHVNKSEPIFVIDCKDIRANWHEVEKHLLPRFLKMPELRQFHADFGLQAKKMGITGEEEIDFRGFLLQDLIKSEESYYVANSSCNIGGLECIATFDFRQDTLDIILEELPAPQTAQIRGALSRNPFSIQLDAKVRIHWAARLGELIQGQHEEFIPMIVTKLFKVEYDPSLTLGPQDPAAVLAGVPLLRV
jgi:hypothetical protein